MISSYMYNAQEHKSCGVIRAGWPKASEGNHCWGGCMYRSRVMKLKNLIVSKGSSCYEIRMWVHDSQERFISSFEI